MLKHPHFEIERDPQRPMPESLRRRLSTIPQVATRMTCDDIERLYKAARAQAWKGEDDPAVTEHLTSCGSCRILYEALETVFRPARRPLPRGLTRRLRGIATPKRPSLMIRDSRLAVAASALLTASLLLLVGDPSKLVRGTAETVTSRATVLAEASEERRQAIWEGVADNLEAGVVRSREILVEQGRSYKNLWSETRKLYEPEQWRQLLGSLTLNETEGDRLERDRLERDRLERDRLERDTEGDSHGKP